MTKEITESVENKYHHGDLNQTLIAAAKGILQRTGLASLSMRKLAEDTGVSRSAPYHHFKDKKALLCAIAEDGFKQQDKLLEGMIDSDDAILRFESFVVAYVHFAAKHPEQYDLMYGGEIWKSNNATASLDDAAKKSFKCWVSEVSKLQEQGVLTEDVTSLRLAQVMWATLHGLCRLLNDGIYIDPNDIDEMGRTAVKLLLKS